MTALTFINGSVSIGDVFASSWGYEQTNVNFYQVVALHGTKTVTVREISAEAIEYGHGFSGEKKPVLNDFISESLKRRIYDFSDSPLIKIHEFESASKTDPEEAHHFTTYA